MHDINYRDIRQVRAALERLQRIERVELGEDCMVLPAPNAPPVLYHATYQAYLPSIIANGLGARQTKNWDASVDGVVCLAETAEQAESFAESSEDTSSDIYDSGIVILQVDASNLALRPDRNIIPPENGNTTCWEYSGTIAPSRLTVLP